MPKASDAVPTWLNAEEAMFRAEVRRFARTELGPLVGEIDRSGEFPRAAIETMDSLGLFSLAVPEEHGGADASLGLQCVVAEELAYATPVASLVVSPSLVTALILRAAGGDVADEYLKRVATPMTLTAVALSEPDSGSDAASITARAVRDGDDYVLNGRKSWITNGGIADLFCVFARTGAVADRARGISAFMLDADTPGFSVAKLEDKMGLRGSTTAECVLEDVRVPATQLVGVEGGGFRYVMEAFDKTRPLISCVALGIAQAALDVALLYAQERRQFGQAIAEFQGLQFLLADMAIALESGRTLTYESARLVDLGSPHTTVYASMAKSWGTDVAMKVTTDAVQVLGGFGYVKDFPVERMMRDAKIFQIFEGTNQIQRGIIARELNAWARTEAGA